jgi:hypothetical protein
MLLFLIKYSRPDLSNAVREFSKCIDKALPIVVKTENIGALFMSQNFLTGVHSRQLSLYQRECGRRNCKS